MESYRFSWSIIILSVYIQSNEPTLSDFLLRMDPDGGEFRAEIR